MYLWRVAIPSLEGSLSIDLDLDPFEKQSANIEDASRRRQAAACWIALLGDSPVDVKPRKVIMSFVASLCADLDTTIRLYGELAHRFISTVYVDPESQEIIFTSDLYEDFRGTPLFREYYSFRQTNSPELFRFIYSFLVFLKKLSVDRSDLYPEALRQWDEVEARISSITFDTPLVETLRNILKVVTSDYQRCDLYPQHGNGAVAEKKIQGAYEKSVVMRLSKALSYYMRDNLAWYPDDWSIFPLGSIPSIAEHTLTSRLAFVPKSYKAVRSICMEPAALQWAQQGVFDWIRRSLADSWLGDHVVLHDQSFNRKLARLGSRSNRYDTIDLSSASDSVSKRLVKAVFPARILYPLWSTRSSMVQKPDGSTVECDKFAPMGSAVCFPVQCYIFSSVVIAAGLYSVLGVKSTVPLSEKVVRDVLPRAFGPGSEYGDFGIFGDDIICDNALTPFVGQALEDLGFRYNDEKSFKGSQAFRESCGGHYFRGADVTPFYWKFSEPLASGLTPSGMSSLIDAANRALDFEYYNLRRAIISQIKYQKLKGIDLLSAPKVNPILFTEDRDVSWAVWSSNPNNHHLVSYEAEIPLPDEFVFHQRHGIVRLVGRAIVDRTRTRLSREMQEYHYVRWFALARSQIGQLPLIWDVDEEGCIVDTHINDSSVRNDETAGMRWKLVWEPTT